MQKLRVSSPTFPEKSTERDKCREKEWEAQKQKNIKIRKILRI
jgi:hypothetical protein